MAPSKLVKKPTRRLALARSAAAATQTDLSPSRLIIRGTVRGVGGACLFGQHFFALTETWEAVFCPAWKHDTAENGLQRIIDLDTESMSWNETIEPRAAVAEVIVDGLHACVLSCHTVFVRDGGHVACAPPADFVPADLERLPASAQGRMASKWRVTVRSIPDRMHNTPPQTGVSVEIRKTGHAHFVISSAPTVVVRAGLLETTSSPEIRGC